MHIERLLSHDLPEPRAWTGETRKYAKAVVFMSQIYEPDEWRSRAVASCCGAVSKATAYTGGSEPAPSPSWLTSEEAQRPDANGEVEQRAAHAPSKDGQPHVVVRGAEAPVQGWAGALGFNRKPPPHASDKFDVCACWLRAAQPNHDLQHLAHLTDSTTSPRVGVGPAVALNSCDQSLEVNSLAAKAVGLGGVSGQGCVR